MTTMATKSPVVAEILALASPLSPVDKAEAIEQLTALLKQELTTSGPKPRRSSYGALAHLGPAPSAEEIDEARREAWANFATGDDY